VSFEEDIRFLTVLATLIGQFLRLHEEIRRKEARLKEENRSLKAKLHGMHDGHFIIGHSKPMQEVYGIIEKISQSDVTALLLGESGTGKELVARALHESGNRKDKPFIKVNCAALPETLLESELFGHERGAFTGAHATRQGRFELADNGVIFLDEIGEMPLSLQAKMLRVLQEKQFERIGGTRTFSVDVRIIAATNVSLEQAAAAGRFRADLYYRLNVVPIHLPPLRDRREDIPLLLNHFLQKSNQRNGRNIKLTSELLDFLVDYRWPGNVREMQNLVERMVILAEGERLTLADLPVDARGARRRHECRPLGLADVRIRFDSRGEKREKVPAGYRTGGDRTGPAAPRLGPGPGRPGTWPDPAADGLPDQEIQSIPFRCLLNGTGSCFSLQRLSHSSMTGRRSDRCPTMEPGVSVNGT